MIEYYKDRHVAVTSAAVRVDGRTYRLTEFVRVWHRRGSRSWGSVAGRSVIGLAMLVPVLLGALGIIVGLTLDASPSLTIALLGGGVLVGLAALPVADVLLERLDRSYARGSRKLEIWADVRGHETLLLQTDDALRFGQIYRALQRALERGERAPAR